VSEKIARKRRKVLISFLISFLISTPLIIFILIYYQLTHQTKGHFINSDGTMIHYTDEGKGTPVILIHGFAVNIDLNWRKTGVIDYLKKDFRVISIDLRGHGLSEKPHSPNEYGIKMAKDIINIMNNLKIEKAHIVGYSLGGFIAIKLATLYPERMLTLSPLGSGWEKPEESHFFLSIDKMIKKLETNSGVEPISTHLDKEGRKTGILHAIWVKTLTRFFNDPQALIGVLKGLSELQVQEEEIRKISLPICLIIGEKDPLRKGAENLKNTLPCSQLIIIPHKDHVTAPISQQFKEKLKDFLLQYTTKVIP